MWRLKSGKLRSLPQARQLWGGDAGFGIIYCILGCTSLDCSQRKCVIVIIRKVLKNTVHSQVWFEACVFLWRNSIFFFYYLIMETLCQACQHIPSFIFPTAFKGRYSDSYPASCVRNGPTGPATCPYRIPDAQWRRIQSHSASFPSRCSPASSCRGLGSLSVFSERVLLMLWNQAGASSALRTATHSDACGLEPLYLQGPG